MPLAFACPACQSALRLANTGLAGKKIRCPKCGEVVTVPAPASEPVAEELEPEVLEEAAPPPRSTGATTLKQQSRSADEEDERPATRSGSGGRDGDESRPRHRARRESELAKVGNALVWILAAVGGVVVLCGGCVIGMTVWVNRTATSVAKDLDKMAKENRHQEKKVWADQWERGKVYDIPAGDGLTLTSRLVNGDEVDKGTRRYRKVFQVRMHAGTTYTIRMNRREPSVLHPVLRLEDFTGIQLAYNDGDPDVPGSKNARIDFNCLQDDIYRVIANDLHPDNAGDFTLLLTKKESKLLGPPDQWERSKVYDVPGAGLALTTRLTAGDDRYTKQGATVYRKIFQVRLDAGNEYTIRMSGQENQGNITPVLVLEGPTGKLLDRKEGVPVAGDPGARIDFSCHGDGIYKVIATSLVPGSTGDFTLSVKKESKPAGPADQWVRGKVYEVPDGGLTLNSRLAVTDERDEEFKDAYRKVFRVQMNAGSMYTIRMNARENQVDLDPVLRVLDAVGKELAFNDDAPGEASLNSRIEFLCPKAGVYQVIATNLRANGTGDFTLLITRKERKLIGKPPEEDQVPVVTTPRFTIAREKAIHGVALSPSGLLLSWFESTDKNLHLWDVKANKSKAEMAISIQATSVGFSEDGKTLATCGYDRLVHLWEVESGKPLRSLKEHSDAVYSLAFSPDGKLLASGAADRAVKVFRVADGKRLYTLSEVTDWVYAVAWSPDGKHLAAPHRLG